MPNKINIIAGQTPAIGYESISVTNTAKSLSTAFTDDEGIKAKRVIITVENAQIRYRYDGTNPTATEGHVLNPFDVLTLNTTENIENFRVIRKGSTNGTIRVTFEA